MLEAPRDSVNGCCLVRVAVDRKERVKFSGGPFESLSLEVGRLVVVVVKLRQSNLCGRCDAYGRDLRCPAPWHERSHGVLEEECPFFISLLLLESRTMDATAERSSDVTSLCGCSLRDNP